MIRRLALLTTALVIVATAACGGGAKDVFDDPPDASKLAVRLSEYKIESKGDATDAKTDLKRRDKVTLDVKLQPGSYVLFCNVSGHYQLGMHTGFKVK